MDIQFETSGNSTIIYLKGELDHHAANMAKERIELHISSALERNIVYDITGLTFMDSSGIGLIAAGYKVARNFGGKVTVLTDNERYLKILALSKMDDLAELKYVSGEENHRQAEKEGVK